MAATTLAPSEGSLDLSRPSGADRTTRPTDSTSHERAPWWRQPLLAFLLTRALVLLGLLPVLLRSSDPGSGPWPEVAGGSALARVLARWDGAWYLWVANRGYPGRSQLTNHLSDVAFFPLFPLLIRGTSSLLRISELNAALVVATVLGAAATLLVWQVANRVSGAATARKATLLFLFFPGSFVLTMAYAEPLLLVAAGACLLFLLRRSWVLAGLAGAVATASRPNALPVLIACGVVALVAIARDRQWKALSAPVLAGSGIAAFFGYLWVHSGDPLAWLRSEREMWHDQIDLGRPLVSRAVGAVTHLPSLKPAGLNDLIGTLGLALAVVGLVWVWRSAWPLAVKAYTIAAIVLPLTSHAVGPRPRMLLAAFPLAIAGAERLSPRAYRAVLGVSAVLLVGLTYATASSYAAVP